MPVPSGLPDWAAVAAKIAGQWRSDAALAMVNYDPAQSNLVSFEFESASAGKLIWLNNFCVEGELQRSTLITAGKLGLGTVSTKFVDLPVAIKAALPQGIPRTASQFNLYRHTKKDGSTFSAWQIHVWVVDAASGKVVPTSELDDSYRQNLNRQFRQIAEARARYESDLANKQTKAQRNGCRNILVTSPNMGYAMGMGPWYFEEVVFCP